MEGTVMNAPGRSREGGLTTGVIGTIHLNSAWIRRLFPPGVIEEIDLHPQTNHPPPRPGRGRPKGAGAYYQTRHEFELVLRRTMRHVQKYDPPISRAKVARHFHLTRGGVKTTYTQLYRWLKQHKVDFDTLKASLSP
jgi:hypothetical protein